MDAPADAKRGVITIATLFWQANAQSKSFSSMYDETWVEKLYRGFARNLTQPFRFVCYVDRPRTFKEPIGQRQIASEAPGYIDCVQPYEMGVPMILVGLDTVVTGNIDHLASYCLDNMPFALPRDPFKPERACNGVALVPGGMEAVATGPMAANDMDQVRGFPHVFIEDVFNGQVQSFKGAVRDQGVGDSRIVYFHGRVKPHEMAHVPWIREHWR